MSATPDPTFHLTQWRLLLMLLRVMTPGLCLIAGMAGFLYGRQGVVLFAAGFAVLSILASFVDRFGIFRHDRCPRCLEPLVFYRPELGRTCLCSICQTVFTPLAWSDQTGNPPPPVKGPADPEPPPMDGEDEPGDSGPSHPSL